MALDTKINLTQDLFADIRHLLLLYDQVKTAFQDKETRQKKLQLHQFNYHRFCFFVLNRMSGKSSPSSAFSSAALSPSRHGALSLVRRLHRLLTGKGTLVIGDPSSSPFARDPGYFCREAEVARMEAMQLELFQVGIGFFCKISIFTYSGNRARRPSSSPPA